MNKLFIGFMVVGIMGGMGLKKAGITEVFGKCVFPSKRKDICSIHSRYAAKASQVYDLMFLSYPDPSGE